MEKSVIPTVIIAILVIIFAIMIRREYINESRNKNTISNFETLSDATSIPETKSTSNIASNQNTPIIMDLNSTDIPAYNAYSPVESPPDQRYQYVPDVSAYLLPYQYLNMQLPYDRWMYYHFPSYYSPNYPPEYTPNLWPRRTYPLSVYDYMNNIFVDNDIYGANYFYDNYANDIYGIRGPKYHYPHNHSRHRYRSDSRNYENPYKLTKNHSRIIGSIDSINVNTDEYPTKESNFAGGWSSQRFTNGMASASGLTAGRGTMRGFGSAIDRNRGRNLNYADRKTSQSYVGGSRTRSRSKSLPRSVTGNRTAEHFGMIEDYQATPESDPGADVDTAIQSILYLDPDFKNRFNNNTDVVRPIGSNRLGRGLGVVTGLEQRQEDYAVG